MTKRFFLVTGVENSGNRMFRDSLCSAGCYGDPIQDFPDSDFHNLPPQVALVRSVPHGDTVPDLKAVARVAQLAGYEVTPLYIYRKTEFSLAGQMRVYERSESVAAHYRKLASVLAYELAAWLGKPLIVVPYEPFVTDARIRAALFATLGFAAPTLEFFNANTKYKLKRAPLPY